MALAKNRLDAPGPTLVTHTAKRICDIVGSAIGLAILLPVFFVIGIAIKLDSPGPVFFRQERVGRDGRPFRIFKFRSMTANAAREGSALTVRADRRVTRIGAYLRQTKIDELPQLFNVFAGEMSLVGPRPEVHEFMKFYTPEQRAIIVAMRPGMTDYAAILFRDESSLLDLGCDPIDAYRHQIMPIKFICYERYSHDIGVVNDLAIIAATILLLVTGRAPGWLDMGPDLSTLLSGRNGAAEVNA